MEFKVRPVVPVDKIDSVFAIPDPDPRGVVGQPVFGRQRVNLEVAVNLAVDVGSRLGADIRREGIGIVDGHDGLGILAVVGGLLRGQPGTFALRGQIPEEIVLESLIGVGVAVLEVKGIAGVFRPPVGTGNTVHRLIGLGQYLGEVRRRDLPSGGHLTRWGLPVAHEHNIDLQLRPDGRLLSGLEGGQAAELGDRAGASAGTRRGLTGAAGEQGTQQGEGERGFRHGFLLNEVACTGRPGGRWTQHGGRQNSNGQNGISVDAAAGAKRSHRA
ncbi:hypothetical protein [Deinococcus yunweiensis]|uniref:hypothetical protein n=1 Tax=Deinococcus yunweiensis TaxID=367282 RepID=UPI00398F4E89